MTTITAVVQMLQEQVQRRDDLQARRDALIEEIAALQESVADHLRLIPDLDEMYCLLTTGVAAPAAESAAPLDIGAATSAHDAPAAEAPVPAAENAEPGKAFAVPLLDAETGQDGASDCDEVPGVIAETGHDVGEEQRVDALVQAHGEQADGEGDVDPPTEEGAPEDAPVADDWALATGAVEKGSPDEGDDWSAEFASFSGAETGNGSGHGVQEPEAEEEGDGDAWINLFMSE